MARPAGDQKSSSPAAFPSGRTDPAATLAFLEVLQSQLGAVSSSQEAADLALALLAKSLAFQRAVVLLLDEETDTFAVLAHYGPAGPLRQGARIPRRVISLPENFATAQPHVCLDTGKEASADPLVRALTAEGLRSYAHIPLLSDGSLLGSLHLAWQPAGALTQAGIDLASHAARSLSLVLRSAREQDQTRRAERRYSNLFRGLPIGLYRTSPAGEILEANPAFLSMLGVRELPELAGASFDSLFADAEDSRRSHQFLDRVGLLRNFELRIRRHDGRLIWVQNNARAVRDPQGELECYEGSLQDITERRQAEERLWHDALHDTLTGLPNRAFFMDHLSHALSQGVRHPEYLFAVLFIDFDRFKIVNDSLGHHVGDLLLADAGRRLTGCLRQVDSLARLGGDEFAILLDGIRDVVEAAVVADRVKTALAKPFNVEGNDLFLTASIGIAMSSPQYQRPEEVLRDADIAMYRAKAEGLGQHVVFDAGMHEAALALLRLETDLRHALARGQFTLLYQPILAIRSGRVMGFEVLLRWRHPKRGLLEPAAFLRRAEESGLILPLGRWVMSEACRQLAEWHRQPGLGRLSVSVNLSRKQFLHPDLAEEIRATLRETRLDPALLRLELTENVLFRKAEEVSDLLLELKGLGVSLDIDDFGIGYSSLSKLSHLPIDALKTDRSLLSPTAGPAPQNPGGASPAPQGRGGASPAADRPGARSGEILRAVMSLASSLGMEVVAEGVETAAQLEELRAMGARLAQGNYLGRPMTPEEASHYLAERG